MQTSEKELMREAKETGFRPEIMEKVWHLMAILDGISVHPFLKERLVLKGGTALNLFFFDLPRLSVDIDLNYIGQLDRQKMLLVVCLKNFWINFGAKARIIGERKLTCINAIHINLRSLRSTILRSFRARNCLKNF